jgi:Domain of unknown function (DUF4126)
VETIQILGAVLGIGFAAGLRLYATIVVLGVGLRYGWLHLPPGMGNLQVLENPYVIGVAACACLIEFIADKVPWVDSVWDSFHTFIRPIGAAALGAAALGPVDPAWKVIIVVLCGGVALASHGSKAATRLLVNHSPEPFTNIGLSLAGDAFVPAAVWVAVRHPVAALTVVVAFLAVFAWVAPKVFRLLRVELAALRALCFPRRASGGGTVAVAIARPDVARALGIVCANAGPLPANLARLPGLDGAVGVRCAATRTMKGLRNSIGYLAVAGDEVVFAARRMFRYRVHRIRIGEIVEAEAKRGILMHQLILRTGSGERMAVNLFRDVSLEAREGAVLGSRAARVLG